MRNNKLIQIMKMKKSIIVAAIMLIATQLISAQQPKDQWQMWNRLTGEWVGEGNGQPGKGEGKFSFQKDLDSTIIVRKNHTVFPATADAASKVHDDLLIVYRYGTNGAQEAIYFDNEGHTIKYACSFTEKSIILTSEIMQGAPRFRFTYEFIDDKTINVSFDMSAPQAPDDFKAYLTGKAFKIK
jgi:hypothetical protein